VSDTAQLGFHTARIFMILTERLDVLLMNPVDTSIVDPWLYCWVEDWMNWVSSASGPLDGIPL
jgi:hypothetical protein